MVSWCEQEECLQLCINHCAGEPSGMCLTLCMISCQANAVPGDTIEWPTSDATTEKA